MSSSRVANDLDILFIVFDNGESTQLRQAIDLLGDLSSLNFIVLALGKPATNVFKGKRYLRTLSDLGIEKTEAHPPNGKNDPSRSRLLTPKALAKLTATWPSVRVTVPGFAYKMQAQIARAWSGVVVECVMDGWGLWNDDWLAAKHFIDSSVCTEVLLPTFVQSSSLLQQHPDIRATVVGNPSMEEWRLVAGDIGTVRRVRAALYGDNPGVLLAGGYGNGHENTMRIFCEASKLVKHLNFSYSPHPALGTNGVNLDLEFLRVNDCERIVVTWNMTAKLDDGREVRINTMLASAASLVTASRYSTVGGQSLYIGIPHAYIEGPHPSRQNVFSQYIPVMNGSTDLASWILGEGSKPFDPKLLGTIVPYLGGDSASRFAQHILAVTCAGQACLDTNCTPGKIISSISGFLLGGVLATCFAVAWGVRQRRIARKERTLRNEVELGSSMTGEK